MMTFEEYRNSFENLWRADDIARNVHADIEKRASQLFRFPERIIGFIDLEKENYNTVIDGMLYTGTSMTLIARAAYAMHYVWSGDQIHKCVSDAALKKTSASAFTYLAKQVGMTEVDRTMLLLCAKMHGVDWLKMNLADRKSVLAQWIAADLRGWLAHVDVKKFEG